MILPPLIVVMRRCHSLSRAGAGPPSAEPPAGSAAARPRPLPMTRIARGKDCPRHVFIPNNPFRIMQKVVKKSGSVDPPPAQPVGRPKVPMTCTTE
eukprot:289071-Pyramimonas_sp.AAC.1